MSRTFADDEIACVKATSFVSEIAPELVPAGERALFMYATPAQLHREHPRRREQREGAAHARRLSRAQRLAARGIVLPPPRNDAELAAVAWACEMTALEAAADAMADRHIAWADFDAMLGGHGRGACAASPSFFGFDRAAMQLAAIADGPADEALLEGARI